MSDVATWTGYAQGWSARHGGIEPRRASALGRWLRLAYAIARVLDRLRVRPTGVTVARVLLNAAVPVLAFVGGRWLAVAAIAALLGALGDNVDGALAVLQARASRLGSYYDAVADRLAEACWLLALWAAGAPGWLIAGAGAVSWLHEYARLALLSATGRQAVSPLGERPTRVIAVVAGLLVAWLAGLISSAYEAGVVTLAAAGWLVFSVIGLLRLLRLGQRTLR